ncbi:MAG: VOC family protein [Anaerolineae bacterium]|nr:VOC family protein [Anaerolineae bacterium]
MSNQSRLPDKTGIGYAHLRVRHLPTSLAFYADGVGFHELHREGDTAYLSADGKTIHLKLTESPDAPPKPPRSIGLYHVAIRVPSRGDLANLFRRLVMREVPFQGFSDHLVSEALYLPDPDNNGVELYRDRPRDEWQYGGEGVRIRMDTLPLNVEALLDDADDRRWVGIAPESDIGHMHLHVSDLAKAEAFYADVAGFDVVVRGYPGALFVAAGGYHHHIGLNVWAGKQSPPPGVVGLIEYSVIVPEAAGFAALWERLQTAGSVVETGENYVIASDQDGNAVRFQREAAALK